MDRNKAIKVDTHHFSLLNSYHKDDFKPIPLTEEILLDCGFENHDSLKFSIDDTLIVDLQDFTFGVNPYDTFWFSECDIIYVHQLQNLYFSVKGQELEFKTLGK